MTEEQLKLFKGSFQTFQLRNITRYLNPGDHYRPAEHERLPVINGIEQMLEKNLVNIQPNFAIWMIMPNCKMHRIFGKGCHASIQVFKEDTDHTRIGVQVGFQAGGGGDKGRGNVVIEEFSTHYYRNDKKYRLHVYQRKIDLVTMKSIFKRIRDDMGKSFTYDKYFAHDWKDRYNCTTWAVDVARIAKIDSFTLEKLFGSSPWALSNHLDSPLKNPSWKKESFTQKTPEGLGNHRFRDRGTYRFDEKRGKKGPRLMVNTKFQLAPRIPDRSKRGPAPKLPSARNLGMVGNAAPIKVTPKVKSPVRLANPTDVHWECMCGALYATRIKPFRCTTCGRFQNTIEGPAFTAVL